MDLAPSDRVSFRWHRAPEARLVQGDELPKGWHTSSYPGPYILLGEPGDLYEPLKECRALFREFASLSGSAESFVEFARTYGGLYREYHTKPTPPGSWAIVHRQLQDAVTLFDALQSRSEHDVLPVSMEKLDRDERERADDMTARQVAQMALTKMIVAYASAFGDGVRLGIAADYSPRGTGLRITFEAEDLRAAMWLQLALAVDGDRRYDSCKNCGKWWDATDAHPKKKTCSDACRKALSRKNSPEEGGETK